MRATGMWHGWRKMGLLSLMALQWGAAVAQVGDEDDKDPFAPQQWKEAELVLPPFPRDSNLVEFYVGPTTSNRFFIDSSSLSTGADGVVRYVLVIRTAGGASNVSYEGIRCETGEYKAFALGHSDGTWSRSRLGQWKPIENKLVNRHHAALNVEYLCAEGVSRTPAESIAAMRRGNAGALRPGLM